MMLFQVDAFADNPFRGNPAGVCILAEVRDSEWMKNVACEMNLSETAFARKENSAYHLRWFTPQTEVSLCGHATLATAHVLWEAGMEPADREIEFHTLSGPLRAKKKGAWIELDFPAREVQPSAPEEKLNEALGVRPLFTGRYAAPAGSLYLLELENERTLRELAPDYGLIVQSGARAVIVTSRPEGSPYDFISRYFAPAVGINEDPVTGSAHCCLTPYWAAKLGKTELLGYQASARTGIIGCTLAGDRVRLRGKAVTIFRAELLV